LISRHLAMIASSSLGKSIDMVPIRAMNSGCGGSTKNQVDVVMEFAISPETSRGLYLAWLGLTFSLHPNPAFSEQNLAVRDSTQVADRSRDGGVRERGCGVLPV
jgi:hypothetical protein